MSRTVLIWLDGSFNQGFRVTLESKADDQPGYGGKTLGRLGSNPEIVQLYTEWQQRYRQLDNIYRTRLTIELEEPEDEAIQEECRQYADTLRTRLNAWIDSNAGDFWRIRDSLVAQLNQEPNVRVLIQTNDPQAQRIPWHLWYLWESYRAVEITLSNPYDTTQTQPTLLSRNSVRILAILGNSEGINVEKDRQSLEQLPGVDSSSLEFLVEPDRDEVFDRLEDARGWDILFFAGHSSSESNGTTGRFYINRNKNLRANSLTIEELRFALETAIENGLKLAIFNSCDGLGLAHQLARLQIPQIIVMREPVPDDVAHTFLKYFLQSYSEGIPIQRAVKIARQKLRRLEWQLPYATWLPVLYQHPTVEPSHPFPPPPPPPNPPFLFRIIQQLLSLIELRTRDLSRLIKSSLLVVFLGLIVISIRGILPKENNTQIQPSSTSIPTSIPNTRPTLRKVNEVEKERISFGEKSLFSPPHLPVLLNKLFGIAAIANTKYDKAISDLQAARKANPNDPETIIYLNNARIKDQKSYTIAVSVPIGSDPKSSLEILRGVAQAQNEINQARGINQVPLKVAIANDDENPDVAQQVASALVNNSKVLGVVGHSASRLTLAAGPIYESRKLVAISPTSTSVELTNFNPYIFRTVPSDSVAAMALATYMRDKMHKQTAVVFFNSKNSYSESLKGQFTKAVRIKGGQVLKAFDVSNPSFNATHHVEEAIKQGAEVLMLATDTSVLEKVLQIVWHNHESKRLSLLGGDDVYSLDILKNGKETAGMVVAVPWDIDSNRMSDFTRQSKELWGSNDINWRTALSYDATKALITALQHEPTRIGVQRTLASKNFSAEGASGTIRFSQGDRSAATIQLVQVVPNPSSSTGYDFVPIEAVNTAAPR